MATGGGSVVVERTSNGNRSNLSEHALVQLDPRAQNLPLDRCRGAVPGAPWLAVSKRAAVKTLTSASLHPQRYGAHTHLERSGHCTQALAASDLTNHLSPTIFNEVFSL